MTNWSSWDRCPPGYALRAGDPEIADLIEKEIQRQNEGLELIASENFVSPAVLEAMGSPLTNKYAEGLPGKRYYGGCEVVDEVEQLAIDRAKELFGADHANVQPHSGAQANYAAMTAFLKPGDTFLGMDLSNGGHLTHGSPVNFSGMLFKAVSYGVTDAGLLDYDDMRRKVREQKPKLVLAGYSAYSRTIDWAAFAEVAREVGAVFMVDMAHFARLVANARQLAAALASRGFQIVSGGTDNHLMLVDLRNRNLTGKVAQTSLDDAAITVNKNTVPKETQSPFVTSGIRIGTSAVTTRGMKEAEMKTIAALIDRVLSAPEDAGMKQAVRAEVKTLTAKFPLYPAPQPA